MKSFPKPDPRAKLMQGNEACAEGALAAGCRFFAGYPITPASEIAEHLSIRLPQMDGTFIQMEDEIASMGAVIGASLAGVKSMTATSGPGFSLMQENLGFACIAEVPCVLVNVMRGGPSTGLPTNPSQGDVMQARWGTHGDHPIIVLCPSSVQECFTLTIKAFNDSEKYRTPVILLMDEVVAHMREKVVLPDPGAVEGPRPGETLGSPRVVSAL
jgi:2-oxoglutarate/2-oxoacid ferredoxin oxidoreductase subunit alpha